MREIEFIWTRPESVRADLGRDPGRDDQRESAETEGYLHFQQDAIARSSFAK